MTTAPGTRPAARCADCLDLQRWAAGRSGVLTCVLRGSVSPGVIRRLAELGLRPGAAVVAGRRTPGGGRVVQVAGSSLALDADLLRALHLVEKVA